MLLIGLVTVNRCGAYLGKNGLFGELLCNTVLFLINVASTVGFSSCFIVVIPSSDEYSEGIASGVYAQLPKVPRRLAWQELSTVSVDNRVS